MAKKLNESSLSRLQQHLRNHDGVCISAWVSLSDRKPDEDDASWEQRVKNSTRKYKRLDSRALKTLLKENNYTIIAIKGFYQYNSTSKSDKEESFAVINTSNDSNFLANMLEFGEVAFQESILYIHAGTYEGEYIYTGMRGEHDKGDVEKVGVVHFGVELLHKSSDNKEGSRILSRVNGRPFAAFDMNKAEQSKEDGSVYITDETNDGGVYIDEGYAPVIVSPITRNDVAHVKYLQECDEKFSIRKALEQLKNIWD